MAQFDPEHFDFNKGRSQNFEAYALMRFEGAELDAENFFKKAFHDKDKVIEKNSLGDIFDYLPRKENYPAHSAFDQSWSYERVLKDIEMSFDYYYRRWYDTHSRLEKLLTDCLIRVKENGQSLDSPHWTIPCSDDIDHKVIGYGHHIGVITRYANTYVVSMAARVSLLDTRFSKADRAKMVCYLKTDLNFVAFRKGF